MGFSHNSVFIFIVCFTRKHGMECAQKQEHSMPRSFRTFGFMRWGRFTDHHRFYFQPIGCLSPVRDAQNVKLMGSTIDSASVKLFYCTYILCGVFSELLEMCSVLIVGINTLHWDTRIATREQSNKNHTLRIDNRNKEKLLLLRIKPFVCCLPFV